MQILPKQELKVIPVVEVDSPLAEVAVAPLVEAAEAGGFR